MDFTASFELMLSESSATVPGVTWCYGIVLWFDTGFTDRFCKEKPVCPLHLSLLYTNSLVTDNLHLWRAHCNGEGGINHGFICIGWHRWVPNYDAQFSDQHREGIWAPQHRHIGWNHSNQFRWPEAQLACSDIQLVTNHYTSLGFLPPQAIVTRICLGRLSFAHWMEHFVQLIFGKTMIVRIRL